MTTVPRQLVYQFTMTLQEITPAIWRRLQVPATYTFWDRSYWIPGSYAPTFPEKRTSLCKDIEKEGFQGGTSENNRVVRHRHIHDPGIQQEPSTHIHDDRQADSSTLCVGQNGRFVTTPGGLREGAARPST